jgi:Fe-S cluster assembly scaffold protein SufB
MKNKHDISSPGSYRFVLDTVGQELEVIGRFKLQGREHQRWQVEIVHAAPNTTSRASIRGVVDDEAQADVSGVIKVLSQAKSTEAFLEERVLLLSPRARAVAVPNLEIETDQVSCSHAATVGNIDEEEIFYLQSRGLTDVQARKMIVDGFLGHNRV